MVGRQLATWVGFHSTDNTDTISFVKYVDFHIVLLLTYIKSTKFVRIESFGTMKSWTLLRQDQTGGPFRQQTALPQPMDRECLLLQPSTPSDHQFHLHPSSESHDRGPETVCRFILPLCDFEQPFLPECNQGPASHHAWPLHIFCGWAGAGYEYQHLGIRPGGDPRLVAFDFMEFERFQSAFLDQHLATVRFLRIIQIDGKFVFDLKIPRPIHRSRWIRRPLVLQTGGGWERTFSWASQFFLWVIQGRPAGGAALPSTIG